MKNTQTRFISLNKAWINRINLETQKRDMRRMVKAGFNIKFYQKINTRKVIAIIIMIINTPLPTCSIVTNPIIYKKIMKFNTDKIVRKLNCFPLRFR